jgi:peptidoglycan/LPS O-acetylase OafA/YrhL
MNKGLSCYLDLVRFSAAVAVFFSHLLLNFGCYDQDGIACNFIGLEYPQHAGHSAVVLFFVLSGYVITYVASERERNFRDYALSRCARIHSVAIPTLFLVALVDISFVVSGYDAALPYQYRSLWIYVPLAMTFTTDHWFLAENGLTHGGWWALSYEVWYYILFAAAFYPSGWKRWVLVIVIGALMGPKLLALLPCWLFGSFVYRMHHRGAEMSAHRARTVLLVTSLVICLAILLDALHGVDLWANAVSDGWLSRHMRFSQWFVGDTLLAGVFAINIFAAKFARLEFGIFGKPIKFVAAFTFIFYLAHGLFITIAIRYFALGMLSTTLAAFIGCFLLGLITERQKERLHRLLERILDRISSELRRALVPAVPK